MTVTMRGSIYEIIVTDHTNYIEYLKNVGKKEERQFERGIANPMTRFESELMPHLLAGDLYYPLSECKNRPGRNHLATMDVVKGSREMVENCYFSNALTLAQADYDREGNPSYMAPKERTRFGPLQIYSFEFDYPDLGFFRRQLSWLRSPGKKATESPMGRFYKACCKWADFRGITVNWSGNKSLHIHAVYDTTVYLEKCGNPQSGLRQGLIAHWRELEKMLLEHLGLLGTNYHSDQHLRFPEQYRRMPNSWRLIEGDNHFLGIPDGTMVKQVALWEWWSSRAPTGATELFHRPTSFDFSPALGRLSKAAVEWQGSAEYSEEEIAYCEDRLREYFPPDEWPHLARIQKTSSVWIAHFHNSANDENPSSVIREGYRAVMLQGRDCAGLMPQTLPASLGEMMSQWVEQMHAPQEEVVEVDGPDIDVSSQFEREFANASSLDKAAAVVDRHLPLAILSHPYLLVKGPEGVGKTTALLRYHPALAQKLDSDALNDRANPRRALYAFISYEAAQEKCEAFNRLHQGSRYIGVLLYSFTMSYQQACQHLNLIPITKAQAGRDGYASHWNAIEAQQPTVLGEFRRRHTKLWHDIGDREPVFFSVHQIAHGWSLSNPTRLMWARSFWTASPQERSRICREETRLSLLVHDEIKPETFVQSLPLATYEWVCRLKATNSKTWTDGTLAQRADALSLHVLHDPAPREFTIEELSGLMALDFHERVLTANSGEYGPCDGPTDIYGACHGREWTVARRCWWQDADATRVIFLTTESVPTAVAQRADPTIVVANLHLAGVEPDAIMVHPRRGVVSDNLEKTVADWRGKHGADWFAVSNKVGGCSETMTHARARGSNELMNRKIVQTMTFLSPGEYEQIQALNGWCRRPDLIRMRHFDECNQTAGRNLGFRKSKNSEHALMIGHRLLELLQPFAGFSRYEWAIQLTSSQRRTIKRKRTVIAHAGTAASAPPVSANDDDDTLFVPLSEDCIRMASNK